MFRKPTPSSARPLELGPLELQVLDVLWRMEAPVTVREVNASFPDLAYTTLMTTLDRLYRKGVLVRQRDGRAFLYEVRGSREELLGRLAADGIMRLLPAHGSGRPLLSMLVEAVGRRDVALLDELEALVRAERARQREENEP